MTQCDSFPCISSAQWQVFDDPYVFGFADNFLPPDVFETLRTEFPSSDSLPSMETLQYGKTFQQIGPDDPLMASERFPDSWRHVMSTIRSAGFLEDVRSWATDYVRPFRRPAPDGSPYLRLFGDRPALREWTVDVTYEFSMLKRDTMLPPHTDSTDKILAFVLYFPSTEWQSEWGGGTQIYRPRDKQYNANWSNSRMPLTDVDLVFDSGFKPNRLFFFVKSANSWHGVTRLACPEGVLRRSFNFALSIPAARRRARVYRLKERLIRRIETPRFRRFRSYR